MKEKVKVLLDLNIDGDCTNLCSLAILNILANKGDAEILATTACFNSPLATGCIKALNRYYGHADIPVGILHSQGATHPTPFMKPVNEKFCPDFPDGEDVPDTVEVMRKVLSSQDDDSVVLTVVGCFASVEALLRSEADEYSPLSGQALAERKIKKIVVMGGGFPTFGSKEQFPENNIAVQIPAAQYVAAHWNKSLILSAYEIGIRTLSLKEFRYHGSDEHPLHMMYVINDGDGFKNGNPSWDQTAVLESVYPGKYFYYHNKGKLTVTDDGRTLLDDNTEGEHTYLLPKVPFEQIVSDINDMIFPEWREYADKQ